MKVFISPVLFQAQSDQPGYIKERPSATIEIKDVLFEEQHILYLLL